MRAARTFQFDLIFLEAVLPSISGLEVCRRLKEDEVMKDIPVVFLSSRSDKAYCRVVTALGTVDFLRKGLSIGDLGA